MADSTQGSKISIAVQTAFGTPNTTSMVDVVLEGEPDVEPAVGVGVTPETTGANPFYNEKSIVNNQASDSAVVCSSLIRQAASGGDDSFLKMAFESGGWSVDAIATDAVVDAGATTSSIPVVDSTGMVAGMTVNIELDDGSWINTLIGAMDSDAIIPAMALPSAPTAGNAVNKAFTVTPNVQTGVSGDKLLTMVHGTNVGTTQAQDCAMTGIGDLVFNANEKLMLQYTFGASNKTRGDVATTHGNTFADGTAALTVYQPWVQFSDTQSTWTSALSASYAKVISATVTPNITAEQIPGFGDANCINNIQGWMQKGVPMTIVLDMLYDSDKLDDFDGDNDTKYIGIIQPGQSESDPSIGFFATQCHISEDGVTATYYGENEHRVQVTYIVNPAGMSGTTDADLGNQPCYISVGDKSS